MTNRINIRALAELAQLDVSPAEVEKLENEIPVILKFVESIQKAATAAEHSAPMLTNVLRSDDNPHASGEYSEKLLQAVPQRDGNRVAVKQVVTRKR